jgi:ATP-dependent Clp protease protease subunit
MAYWHVTRGAPPKRITRDFSRDRFMTPQEAKEYGFIDEILQVSK